MGKPVYKFGWPLTSFHFTFWFPVTFHERGKTLGWCKFVAWTFSASNTNIFECVESTNIAMYFFFFFCWNTSVIVMRNARLLVNYNSFLWRLHSPKSIHFSQLQGIKPLSLGWWFSEGEGREFWSFLGVCERWYCVTLNLHETTTY